MNYFQITFKRLNGFAYKKFTCNRLMFLSKMPHRKNKNIIILGLIPIIPTVYTSGLSIEEKNQIEYSSNNDVGKEERTNDRLLDSEKTPWERVKAIYQKDEYGNYSKQMTAIINSCYMATFVGAIYGGVQKSRIALVDFMERNQATIFENHLDAKRRLQNHVTIHFGKGAFQWAWRMTAFTGGFTSLFFSLHAFRGTTKIVDYAASGAAIGALMRVKLGPPGIIIGGAVGGVLGFVCGLTSETMLSLFGTSYDELLAEQYEYDRYREKIHEDKLNQTFEESGNIPKEAIEMLKDREDSPKDI